MEQRLPAHLEVGALLRQVQAAGGFAMVLAKGDRDAGSILVVTCENGANTKVYEKIPHVDGTRAWRCSLKQDAEKPSEIPDYLEKRQNQDPDLWIIELDIADGERFIGLTPSTG